MLVAALQKSAGQPNVLAAIATSAAVPPAWAISHSSQARYVTVVGILSVTDITE